MHKREADTILLACKKHSIQLSMRKEGDVYMVTFINKIEIKSFEAAKLITNGLAIEIRNKKEMKQELNIRQSSVKLDYSKYPSRKKISEGGVGWGERHGVVEE